MAIIPAGKRATEPEMANAVVNYATEAKGQVSLADCRENLEGKYIKLSSADRKQSKSRPGELMWHGILGNVGRTLKQRPTAHGNRLSFLDGGIFKLKRRKRKEDDVTAKRKPRDVATVRERIAINDMLRQEVTILGPEKCEYNDPNVNDQVIADRLGVSPSSVAFIRVEMFGKIRSNAGNAGSDGAATNLDMVREVRALQASVDEMAEQIKFLAQTISDWGNRLPHA